MNILLLGSGGREHALAWKLTQSKQCKKLYIAPGNAGTALCGENTTLDLLDFEAIGRFALEHKVGMVVVGPEEPLVRGLGDHFQGHPELSRIKFIGPSKAGAALEGSKAWAKAFMARHGIPTATHRTFDGDQLAEGLSYIQQHSLPVVLKADGLAAGKGVVICQTHEQAEAELKAMLSGKFGDASAHVLVEQYLSGVEFSVFVLTDGQNYRILPVAKDYKRAGVGDTGPNTGGMGAVSPVPFVDGLLLDKVQSRILRPTLDGLKKEGIPYVGFIFLGLIKVGNDPYLIEYNCRLGDPETEVVLPRLRSDLVSLFYHCAKGTLSNIRVRTDPRAAATVVLASGGYPGDYEKGKPIEGLNMVHKGFAFHAGTKTTEDGQVVTNGGRVLALTSYSDDIESAVRRANANARRIRFEGKYYRDDIGKDLL